MMFGLKRLNRLSKEDVSFIPSENALMKMNIKEFKERMEYIEKITYYKNMCKLSIGIGMICIAISILIALMF